MSRLRQTAAAAVALVLCAAGAAHAEDVDLTATLDQCRPDAARATTDELIARAQAQGWPDFEKAEIGKLPVMASTRTVGEEGRRPPTLTYGVLGVNGGGTWAFVCAVETKPARLREIVSWAKTVYPDLDEKGWAGTITDGAMASEDREALAKNLPTRLGELPAGQRIVMFSITGDRKKSTVTTQIFEKLD